MFVYDVTKEETADFIPESIKYYRKLKGKNFHMLLLGNKTDIVSEENIKKVEAFAKKLAENNKIQFLGISCKKGTNIDEAANHLVKVVMVKQETLKANKIEEPKFVIKEDTQDNDGCCGFLCK